MEVKIPLKMTRTLREVKSQVQIYFGFWLIGRFCWVLFNRGLKPCQVSAIGRKAECHWAFARYKISFGIFHQLSLVRCSWALSSCSHFWKEDRGEGEKGKKKTSWSEIHKGKNPHGRSKVTTPSCTAPLVAELWWINVF